MSEKTKGEELREKLFYQPKNLSEVLSPEEKAEAENFSVPYKRFLDHAKTEREAVSTIVELLEKAGYTPFVPGTKYPAGAKVYLNNRARPSSPAPSAPWISGRGCASRPPTSTAPAWT